MAINFSICYFFIDPRLGTGEFLKIVRNYLSGSEILVPKRRQWTHGTMRRCWRGEEASGWVISLCRVWTKATSISDKDSWQNSQSHRKMRCDMLFLITVWVPESFPKITVSRRNLKAKASFSLNIWGGHWKYIITYLEKLATPPCSSRFYNFEYKMLKQADVTHSFV